MGKRGRLCEFGSIIIAARALAVLLLLPLAAACSGSDAPAPVSEMTDAELEAELAPFGTLRTEMTAAEREAEREWSARLETELERIRNNEPGVAFMNRIPCAEVLDLFDALYMRGDEIWGRWEEAERNREIAYAWMPIRWNAVEARKQGVYVSPHDVKMRVEECAR